MFKFKIHNQKTQAYISFSNFFHLAVRADFRN